jgi:hypothetical protein
MGNTLAPICLVGRQLVPPGVPAGLSMSLAQRERASSSRSSNKKKAAPSSSDKGAASK